MLAKHVFYQLNYTPLVFVRHGTGQAIVACATLTQGKATQAAKKPRKERDSNPWYNLLVR